jgi:hypothetical protein
MAIVYRHIRLDKTQPFYIGIGADEERAYCKKQRNAHWHNIAKAGYEVEILFTDLNWEQACEKEREFIKLYGRRDLGTGTLVNWTDGGEGKTNPVVSEETRRRLSVALKGKAVPEERKIRLSHTHKNLPKEVRDRMNAALIRGESHHWTGKNKGADNANAKIVLDTATGIYYETAKEAVNASRYNAYSHFTMMLKGVRPNTSTFIYV